MSTYFIYHGIMVYPYLSYCNISWTSTYPTRLQSIFMTQKKLVRIMTFSNYRESSKHLYFTRNQQIFVALFVYSFFNNKLPSIFEKKTFLQMMLYIATTHAQLQNYILTIKKQIMENFLQHTGEQIFRIIRQKIEKQRILQII